MGKALYRKHRSTSLDEVVGQKHVTEILKRSIAKGHIAHAYLLTGPRGVGKTSIARILAHEINGLPYSSEGEHLDIIEIDAASNNGVDDVRDLREKARIAPVSAAKKVYIIDEVHMLSKQAFNALLKTLEEPPEHVVFILATTDVDKLPATITSRTQRFSFRAITPSDATTHLRAIADKEGITIDDTALNIIALRGDGSFRDSISLLDQLSSLSDETTGITKELVEQVLGLAPADAVANLLASVDSGDTAAIVAQLDTLEQGGIQPTVLADQLLREVRQRLAKKPEYARLIDALLAARSSTQTQLKLLTALVNFGTPSLAQPPRPAASPKSAALQTSAPVISAPVAPRPNPQPVARQAPVAKPSTKQSATQVATPEAPPREAVAANPDGFDWEKLLEHVQANHMALNAVLSKCSPELDGETLTLYTKNKFNKTKLDDAKYRPLLAEAIVAIGAGDLLVETIATPPPPKDSVAAAVADIMGGGEEVSVET